MKARKILLIDSYKYGNELVSQHLIDLEKSEDEIFSATTYSGAEKMIDIFNSRKIPYIAIFDSSIPKGDYVRVCTSELVDKVRESDNIAVLLSADTSEHLSDNLKKQIYDNKLHYITKSSEILGCAKTFHGALLASALTRA